MWPGDRHLPLSEAGTRTRTAARVAAQIAYSIALDIHKRRLPTPTRTSAQANAKATHTHTSENQTAVIKEGQLCMQHPSAADTRASVGDMMHLSSSGTEQAGRQAVIKRNALGVAMKVKAITKQPAQNLMGPNESRTLVCICGSVLGESHRTGRGPRAQRNKDGRAEREQTVGRGE